MLVDINDLVPELVSCQVIGDHTEEEIRNVYDYVFERAEHCYVERSSKNKQLELKAENRRELFFKFLHHQTMV